MTARDSTVVMKGRALSGARIARASPRSAGLGSRSFLGDNRRTETTGLLNREIVEKIVGRASDLNMLKLRRNWK
jgi:hypothetical protein